MAESCRATVGSSQQHQRQRQQQQQIVDTTAWTDMEQELMSYVGNGDGDGGHNNSNTDSNNPPTLARTENGQENGHENSQDYDDEDNVITSVSFASSLHLARQRNREATTTESSHYVNDDDATVNSGVSYASSLRLALQRFEPPSSGPNSKHTTKNRITSRKKRTSPTSAASSVWDEESKLTLEPREHQESRDQQAQEQGAEDRVDDFSSVGWSAPSLSSEETCRTTNTWEGKSFTATKTTLQLNPDPDDDQSLSTTVSAMGSTAPTLSGAASVHAGASVKNMEIQLNRHQDDDDDNNNKDRFQRQNAAVVVKKKNKQRLGQRAKDDQRKTLQKKNNKNNLYSNSSSTIGSHANNSKQSRSSQKSNNKKTSSRKSPRQGNSSSSRDVFEFAVHHPAYEENFSPPQIAGNTRMDLLNGVLGRDDFTSALEDVVGTILRKAAAVGFLIWVSLMALMVAVAPIESYQYMNDVEHQANVVILVLLVTVNLTRLSSLLVNDRNWNFLGSGAMTACFVVQMIAISSVAAMTVFPTPVLVDHVTGMRVHLVRWVEWTALAFIMTFLTEGVDLSLEDTNTSVSWIVATMITVSTACGGIMAFCTTVPAWLFVFCGSWMLFCVLYVRFVQKAIRLHKMDRGHTTCEKEDYERAKFAFKLLIICCVLWTFLALAYSGCCVAAKYAPPGSFWANNWLVLVVENICEVLSKIGYLSILMEIHEHLFDDAAKTARRLGELQTYMSAVWDTSSDVVVICSKHDHLVHAAVSPAFFNMGNPFGWTETPRNRRFYEHDQTLVMQIDAYEGSYGTYEIDLSKPVTREQAVEIMKSCRRKTRMVTPTFEKNLNVLSDLICDACTCAVPPGQKHHILLKDFFRLDQDRDEQPLHCEAKIVQLKDKVSLLVLRDVTAKQQLKDHLSQQDEDEVHEEQELGDNDSECNVSVGLYEDDDF